MLDVRPLRFYATLHANFHLIGASVSHLHKHRYSNPAIAMRDCLHVVCGEPDIYRKTALREAVENNPKLNW